MTEGFVNLMTSLRLSRPGMAFVVVLLALTHTASFAHFALIQHEQCPEHGDWMHVHGGAAHHADGVDANWHSQETADGHDHCSAPTALRERVAFRALQIPPQRSLPHLLPTAKVATAASQLSSPVTLRTAPKTSPPA